MAGDTEPEPKHRDIVIVTSSLDANRREKLKAAHIDPQANYHWLSVYELGTKVRGLTLAGLVLDTARWDTLTDDGRKACANAAITILRQRGLKTVQELITIVP